MGVLVSGYSQAYNAGVKGREILTETFAGYIPIEPPKKGKVVLNTTMLKKLGIKTPVSVLLGATLYGEEEE